jgi:hypothetical protein
MSAIYPNTELTSSRKNRPSSALELARTVPRKLNLLPTWPLLQTIKLAIQTEARTSQVSLKEAAEVLLAAAQEFTYVGIDTRFEARVLLLKVNMVDIFWFIDSRWKHKSVYQQFRIDLAKKRSGLELDEILQLCRKHQISLDDFVTQSNSDFFSRIIADAKAARIPAPAPLPPCEPDTNFVWGKILGALKARVNPHSFDTWLRPTRFDHTEGDVLYVRVPTPDFKYAGEKYGDLIRESIDHLGLAFNDVRFVVPAGIHA